MLQCETTSCAEGSKAQAPSLLTALQDGLGELRKHLSLGKSVDQTAAQAVKNARSSARQTRARGAAGVGNFTPTEVAKHSSSEDAWLIIDGKVYDVTDFDHPGGDVLLSYAGQDASEVFAAMHPTAAPRAYLKTLCIGSLGTSRAASIDSGSSSNLNMLEGFARLKRQLSQAGLMTASRPYYIRKLAELLAMGTAGMVLLLSGVAAQSAAGWWAAAVLLGLCIAQSGWLGHDFCHLQVRSPGRTMLLHHGCVLSRAPPPAAKAGRKYRAVHTPSSTPGAHASMVLVTATGGHTYAHTWFASGKQHGYVVCSVAFSCFWGPSSRER